ncbi:hypothetical protein C8F04DRAFT_65738 [Mycena alexandri]|uniref:Uncharacterized protein n=1 Tax=Mycena alexandri TaxID=1745969 RepID=A0AAD6S201_9AGAR|nr:hypothetical protein C8F04DRAFT_334885 [Mycena alexandri]KAJ7028475.1 hypothetical protein C8F04DRAFT_65738 [Mycena alexandri]
MPCRNPTGLDWGSSSEQARSEERLPIIRLPYLPFRTHPRDLIIGELWVKLIFSFLVDVELKNASTTPRNIGCLAGQGLARALNGRLYYLYAASSASPTHDEFVFNRSKSDFGDSQILNHTRERNIQGTVHPPDIRNPNEESSEGSSERTRTRLLQFTSLPRLDFCSVHSQWNNTHPLHLDRKISQSHVDLNWQKTYLLLPRHIFCITRRKHIIRLVPV